LITKQDIEEFYTAINSLNIKFPGKVVAEKTGYSRGTVSDYMNRKLPPSEEFMTAFYEAFPESKKVRKETVAEEPPAPYEAKSGSLTDQLMEAMVTLMKTQNQILLENKQVYLEKVNSISIRIEAIKTNQETLTLDIKGYYDDISGSLLGFEKTISERFSSLSQQVEGVSNATYLNEYSTKKGKSSLLRKKGTGGT
jgi:transcriptional regulator with XRE-family HTH domain